MIAIDRKRPNMNLATMKSLVLLLGGIVMICIGVYFTASHIKFVHNAERATGVIIEILSKRTAKGTNLYNPIVRYLPLRYEEPIQFTARPGLWSWLYKVGEEVTVVYHLDNPHEAKIKSFWMLWFLPLITMMFGLMCLFAGGHSWKKRS